MLVRSHLLKNHSKMFIDEVYDVWSSLQSKVWLTNVVYLCNCIPFNPRGTRYCCVLQHGCNMLCQRCQTQRAEQVLAGDGWEPGITINPQEGSFQSDRTGPELDSGVDGTTLHIATNITDPYTSNEWILWYKNYISVKTLKNKVECGGSRATRETGPAVSSH